MSKTGTLYLILDTRWGDYRVAIDVDEMVAREAILPAEHPAPFELAAMGMEGAVKVLRRREFRKDLLENMARQLARRLGERMEDLEGWHGEDRRESAEKWAGR